MFRYRNRLRRVAAQVLLLWLFGVGAGLANACFAAGAAGQSGHHCGPAAAAPSADDAGADHRAAPGKTNCQDFCDKSKISIPPLKLALDHAQAGDLLAPSQAPVPVLADAESAARWVPHWDSGSAPPIPIAFLRLAL